MTTTSQRYRRGEVVLLLFPHSDLRNSSRRPALIIQADGLETSLSHIIVAMITSRMFRANHESPASVILSTPEGRQSALSTDSVAMTDNLATIMLSEIEGVIASLPMTEIDIALRRTLSV
ncbi:MAG: type II toxin-antitoxin system PemK/MazF family toxin [Chloroflexota bacterium]|nr:type II toxin-antitoxin system PemK/MazF family toxin [Chloroflexota bacterium]